MSQRAVGICLGWVIIAVNSTHGQSPSYTVGWNVGIEVLFTPDSEPLLDGRLMGGTLSARTGNDATIVTFASISLMNLHHVGAFGAAPTPTVADHLDPIHAPYDSHLLITSEMIGGSAGGPLRETGADDVDAGDPAGVQDLIPNDRLNIPPLTFRGDIENGNGAFFFRTNGRRMPLTSHDSSVSRVRRPTCRSRC